MPREKKFDEYTVLNQAMIAFWRNGYDGTSMKHLIGCMGLNPGSIYAAFGDKRELFCRVMTCYTDQIKAKHKALEEAHTPRGVIFALLEEMIATIHSKPQHDGCFMVNTALDIAPQDREVQKFISQWFDDLEEFFIHTITQAQKIGEINAELDPQKAARRIITLVCGTQVLARVNSRHPVIDDLIEQIEDILK